MRLVLVLYLAFLVYAFRKETLFWLEKFWILCLEVPRRLSMFTGMYISCAFQACCKLATNNANSSAYITGPHE